MGKSTGSHILVTPLAAWAVRLSVVDDEFREDELHLLRLMPAAWRGPGQSARFEKMPTVFGPVTLRTRRIGDRLEVAFRPRFRVAPRNVIAHLPPVAGLKTLIVNGRETSSGCRVDD